MEDHIADPLTLAQIAMISEVTPRHLNRLFRDTFGESTMAYYRNLRLNLGRRLVRGSGKHLAEIAEATGFANAGHFSTCYLKAFGQRPQMERLKRSEAY